MRRKHRLRVVVNISRPVWFDVWRDDADDPCDLTPSDKAAALEYAEVDADDNASIAEVRKVSP